MTKRRLSDLYVRGQDVTIDDGDGDPVTVWVQKLNPLEQAEASREADRVRSKVIAAKRDHDSDIWQAARAEAEETEDAEVLIRYLLVEERLKAHQVAEAKVAAEDEWSKDNYVAGLRDAWAKDLRQRHAEDPDDPEADRVYVELNRFNTTVEEQVEDRMAPLRRELEELPVAELRKRAAERAVDMQATQMWADEFYRTALFFAVREPDSHADRYFLDRQELDALAGETYAILRRKLDELTVEPLEGKGLGETPSSSPLSEQPEPEATERASGLVGASA